MKKRSPGKRVKDPASGGANKPLVPPAILANLRAELNVFLSETGLERASANQLSRLLAGGGDRDLVRVFARLIANDLKKMRADYEGGKKLRLLAAAVRCGKTGVLLPDWIVDGLEEIHRRYTTCEVRTMDEAFGVERPKGFHAGAAHEEIVKSVGVFKRVVELRRGGCAVSDDFFAGVGQEFGVSATKARNWYYGLRKHFGSVFREDQRPRRARSPRPAGPGS
jgi:hypothetical protein